MRWGPVVAVALVAELVMSATTSAIMALRPEPVGPPHAMLGSDCPLTFGKAGEPSPGVPIPYPALRIGTRVPRAAVPFFTGGSGTGNNILE